MLCPVCATEMNNSQKCPFCGHVCDPGEDNTVTLNGEVISTGHRNHWCQTTDDQSISIQGDLIPYNPNGDIDYQHSGWSGMQMQMPGAEGEFQRRKGNKVAKWALIIMLLLGWGLPFLLFIIGCIIIYIGQG